MGKARIIAIGCGAGLFATAPLLAQRDVIWARQLGTRHKERGYAVAIEAEGNVSITGETYGSLGRTSTGGADILLAKYDPEGNLLGIRQFGTDGTEDGFSLALDVAGNAHIAGRTSGNIGGPSAGLYDGFVMKIEPGCYADCYSFSGPGVLNLRDFLCFQDRFVLHDPYACNCDTSTGLGVCDIFDFLCFQNAFVGACP